MHFENLDFQGFEIENADRHCENYNSEGSGAEDADSNYTKPSKGLLVEPPEVLSRGVSKGLLQRTSLGDL